MKNRKKTHFFLSKTLILLSTALPWLQVGCFVNKTNESLPLQSQMDVDISKDQINAQQLRNLTLGLRDIFHDGVQFLPLSMIIDAMQLEGPITEVLPGILAAHPNPVTVECKGNLCRGTSDGSAHSFLASFIDIPVFGVPTVYISPRVEIELRLSEDGSALEVCKIIGVRAKATGLGGTLDGFLGELDADTIRTLKTDIGYGGSYPNSSCSP